MAKHRGPAASVALLLSAAVTSWCPVQCFLPPSPPKWGVPTTPHAMHSPLGKASSAGLLRRRLVSQYVTADNSESYSTSSDALRVSIGSEFSAPRESLATSAGSTRSRSGSSSATINRAPGRGPSGSNGGKKISGSGRSQNQGIFKGKATFVPPTRGDRNSVRRAFKQAQQMLKQGRVEQGKDILKSCLEADPTDSHSWLALALVESRRGCKSEARAIFEKGTHNCPDSVHLWQAWALLEAKSGAHDSARAKFAKGLALDPGNSFVCHAWGQLEASQGDAKRARALYQQALAYGPQPQVIAALAELELAAGDFEAARELFRTGIDGDTSAFQSFFPPLASGPPPGTPANNAGTTKSAKRGGGAGPPAAGAGVESAMRPANWEVMSTTQKKNWRGRQNRAAKERGEAVKPGAGHEVESSSSDSKVMEAPSTGSPPPARKQKESTATKASKKQPSMGASKKDERMDAAPLLRAWAMLEENRFHDQDKAHALLTRAAAEFPLDISVGTELAKLEERRGHLEEARALLERYSKLKECDANPRHGGALYNTWVKLEAKHASSRRAVALPPPSLLTTSSTISNADSGVAGSALNANGALPMNDKFTLEGGKGENAAVLNTEEDVNQRLADEEEAAGLRRAAQLAREGLERFPAEFSLHQTLGTVLTRQGRYSEARASFARSVALVPTAPAFVAWALMEESWGRKRLRSKGKDNEKKALQDEASAVKEEQEEEEEEDMHVEEEVDGVRPGGAEAARRLFERGISADPTHGPLYNAYGAMEARLTRAAAARAVYRRGVESARRDAAHVWHGMATLELQLGHIDTARELFREGIDRFTNGGFSSAAAATSGSASFDAAMVAAESAAATSALQAAARKKAYDSAGQYQPPPSALVDDEDDVKGASRILRFEDARFLIHSLGMLEMQLHSYPAAFEAFARGLCLYPDDSHLLLGAALTEMRLNEVDSARELFRRAVRSNAKHAHAWQAWGVFEAKQSNLKAARTLFEAGLRECPDHCALWQAYGMLEVSVEALDRARQCFRTGLLRCPGKGNVQLLQAWGCLEMRDGDPSKARDLIQQALTKDPTHGPCWTAYAVIEDRCGNHDDARRILEQGMRSAPHHGPLYRTYAEMEAKRGDYGAARALYQRGIAADPFYAQLFHSFAEMEATLGNIAALKELNDAARSLYSGDAGLREAQRVLAERRKLRFSRGRAPTNQHNENDERNGGEGNAVNDVSSIHGGSAHSSEEVSDYSSLLSSPKPLEGRLNEEGHLDALGEELLRLAKGGGADAEDL